MGAWRFRSNKMVVIGFIFAMVISFVLGGAFGYQRCVEEFKVMYANELMRIIESQRKIENGENVNTDQSL
jgi:hypothetical protein